jgi:endo-1,4-beta-xylanase
MQQLAQMGLSVRISEIDVHGDDSTTQAEQYKAALSACIESSNCTSFTTWGISDAFGSTTEIHLYPLSYGDDLLWDSQFNPKLAFSALQSLLKNSAN